MNMNLEGQLLFLVIFGLIGFVIGYFTGFNPANAYSQIGIIVFLVPVFLIVIKVAFNPDTGLDAVNYIITWYADNIVGIVIGDLAGTIVGSIVGGKK
jgi:hypothetical protein